MTDLHTDRPFIDHQTREPDPAPDPATQPSSLLAAVADLAEARTRQDTDKAATDAGFALALRAARQEHSLAEIAKVAGLTRARVHQLTKEG